MIELTAWTVQSSLMKTSQGRPGGTLGGRSPWQVIPAPSAWYGAHIYAAHAPKFASNLGAGVTLVGKLTFNVLNSVVVRNQEAVDKYVMQREPGLGLVSVSNHIRWGELLFLYQGQRSSLHNKSAVQPRSDISSEPLGSLPAESLPSTTSAVMSSFTSV